MALPAQIAVKYTEEEAAYLSIRPVVRQTFQLPELLDMILGVTGKDATRVQQILRTGTLVFNFYRYWWTGFDADAAELAAALAQFPDADPSRAFRAEECNAVLLAGKSWQPAAGHITLPANAFEMTRAEAARKRLFSGRSFWDALVDVTNDRSLAYLGYSYLRRADVFSAELAPEQAAALARAAVKLASRSVRAHLSHISAASRLFFLCPRSK